MALALRSHAPIFVEQRVLDKSARAEDGQSDEAERLRRWLENVDPEELGRYEM
jgi:bifunctional DNase/RNase